MQKPPPNGPKSPPKPERSVKIERGSSIRGVVKAMQNRQESKGNGAESAPKRAQVAPQTRKVGKNQFSKVVRCRVASRTRPRIRTHALLEPFWLKMVAKGCLFGNPENRKWHQNRPVEERSAPGPAKNSPRERFWKNKKNL